MAIKEGDAVPDVKLTEMADGKPSQVSLAELARGKRVVVFAVPGAFTPTCSMKHLPGFVEQEKALRAKGIDEIVCLAVNDAFVMDAWGKAFGVGDKILLLADGNADWARAMGLEADFAKFGMGVRSKRFSMIVEDGVVKELNVEAPGEFKVSAAEATVCQL